MADKVTVAALAFMARYEIGNYRAITKDRHTLFPKM